MSESTPDLKGEVDGFTTRLRLAIGPLSQAEIARRAQISLKTLERYLAGEGIKLKTVIDIAEVCGVSVEWLATGRLAQAADGQPADLPLEGASLSATLSSQNVSGSGKSHYVALPRDNIAASAGGGALAEHAGGHAYLDLASIPRDLVKRLILTCDPLRSREEQCTMEVTGTVMPATSRGEVHMSDVSIVWP